MLFGAALGIGTALAVASHPWSKPVDGTVPVAGTKPVDAVPVSNVPNDERTEDGLWKKHPTPLRDDLERGRWKAGDAVEDVLARYKPERMVHVRQHGDFTTIHEYRLASYGPIRARYEVVAFNGRLKTAGMKSEPARSPYGDQPYAHTYFGSLTKEERLAYVASYVHSRKLDWLTLRWIDTPSGAMWYSKRFLIGPGKISNFGK
jgi:hypothetical protein